MTTFDDRLEINGVSPDQEFSLINRGYNDWELTVTGVKDVETGEKETLMLRISSIEVIAVLAQWIDAPEFPEVIASFKEITNKRWAMVPDYLKIIP